MLQIVEPETDYTAMLQIVDPETDYTAMYARMNSLLLRRLIKRNESCLTICFEGVLIVETC